MRLPHRRFLQTGDHGLRGGGVARTECASCTGRIGRTTTARITSSCTSLAQPSGGNGGCSLHLAMVVRSFAECLSPATVLPPDDGWCLRRYRGAADE
jgi:hypothetical protein